MLKQAIKCEEMVQNLAGSMLKAGLVEEIVAFGHGEYLAEIVPLFITDPAEVSKIITTSYYPASLAKLVAQHEDKHKKIGMVVRSCDARALIELAKRQQLIMDNLYLIGIECYGVTKLTDKQQEIFIFPEQVEIDGELKPLDEAILLPNCRRCEHPIPSMTDVGVRFLPDGNCVMTAYSEKGKGMLAAANIPIEEHAEPDITVIKQRAARNQEKDFGDLKKLAPKERLNYWLRQFDKCIKCYGCRNACPICYCKECYLEPKRGLIEAESVPPERLYHIGRLLHICDSCVGCGQCEAACPMGIPVAKLYQMMSKDLGELFDYEPGMDVKDLPPVSRIDEEDLTKTGVDQ